MKRTQSFFTLVELLCVIMIIGLLASISLGVTHLAFSKAEDTKMQSLMEMLRLANEQYKSKYGFYLPNIGSVSYDSKYYCIPLNSDFLGQGYEMCVGLVPEGGNEKIVYDVWGNPMRYLCPGYTKYNVNTYDIYSIGPDGAVGNNQTSYLKAGQGDDIANFKNK